jgi:hypothetical protein
MWARVGGGSAERAEGRSAGAARAGKRARRSGAQPGLDEVEKSVTALIALWLLRITRSL